MSFKIREAESADMKSVLKLINELAVFEKEPNAVKITVDDLVKNGFKEHPAFYIYLAELDNAIVGMALFYHRFSTWEGASLHLEDLIVTQRHRGKGIGKGLLDGIIAKAKSEKLRRVEWNVLDWNTPAIEFYKKVGANVLEDWLVVQLDENGIENY